MDANNGEGSNNKRSDILRGILKIRRKRNSSVSKATSRDRSNLSRLVSNVNNKSKISGTCPSCSMSYDRANKRRLIDSCGHERCYSCIGKNEKCALCLKMGSKDLTVSQELSAPSVSFIKRHSLSWTDPCQSNNASPSNTIDRSKKSSKRTSQAASQNNTPVNTMERSKRPVLMSSTPVNSLGRSKRSRYDSLLNISNVSVATPENTLPRRRKEVVRRGSEDILASSHANLVSTPSNRISLVNLSSSCQQLKQMNYNFPKPLYFEVPTPVPAPLVGRHWLWHEIRDHLNSHLPTNKGAIISGGPGTGKTSSILTLVDRSVFGANAGLLEDAQLTSIEKENQTLLDEDLSYLSSHVVAYHFCQSDNAATCHVSQLVHNVSAQLAQCPLLAPYHHLLQSDTELLNQLSFEECTRDPCQALVKGILEPLTHLGRSGKISMGLGIIVIDGLCEAEHHRPDYGDTIASFFCKQINNFPSWLKVVVTVRSSLSDICRVLPFHRISLDADGDERIKRDLSDYIFARTSVTPLATKLHTSGRNKNILTKLDGFLVTKSNGCFLYIKLILDLVEKGKLTLKTGNFKIVPQNLSEIYQLAFNLKFSSSESFVQVADILSICLASLQPINLYELFSIYNALFIAASELSWVQFREKFELVSDLVIIRRDGTLMCFHPTMRDWLRRKNLSEKFQIDIRQGHSAIALNLSRHLPVATEPESTAKNAEKILQMGHHVLKSNLCKNSQNPRFSTRQLQACFTATAVDDISLALGCLKNIYSPIIKVSRLLLLAGADPNHVTDEREQCPILGLHCHHGHVDMVSLLLEYGADPNLTNDRGETPLLLAVSSGHLDIVTLLIRCEANILQADNDGVNPVVAASRAGHLSVLEYLLDQDACGADACSQALTQSILHQQTHVSELLLDDQTLDLAHVDPLSGLDCLGAAASVADINCLRFMLRRENSNADLSAALHAACSSGHNDVVEFLMQQGVSEAVKDSGGRSCLMLSAAGGHTSCIQTLINSGSLLEEADNEGLTALNHAIINNQCCSAQVLLQRGANVNCVDSSGRSPLDIAIYQGSPEMVEILLDNGANMEKADVRGIKPLDRVIGHGNSLIVSVFLRKGAKLGATTWAMAQGNCDIQLILLNKLMDDGNTLYRQNKLTEAAHRYKYALKRLGSIVNTDWAEEERMQESDWPLEMETNLLLNLSRVERRLGRFQTSIQLASKVLDQNPACVQAFVIRAKAARSMGLFRDAFVDFNNALELMPGNRELKKVILKMKDGFKNEMSSSIMSCYSTDSIKFIDDCSVDMDAS